MRLNRYIASSGYSSRRKADILIREGKVIVNGQIIREPWYRVNPGDSVIVKGRRIELSKYTYIVLNKPKGFIVTRKDKFAKNTIYRLLPKEFRNLFPVGRLDKNSRGLLLLTNDGKFCYKYTHPKFEVEKEYLLLVKGLFSKENINKACQGIKEGKDLLKVKNITIQKVYPDKTELAVVVTEGKKRHLRRLFSSLGFRVLDLKRIRMGKFSLGNLKEGYFRVIRPNQSNDRR